MGNPIEVVVIRPVALALPAPPGPEPACGEPVEPIEGPPPGASRVAAPSDDRQRDVGPILDALQCQVRRRLLVALAPSTGSGQEGSANVGTLVRHVAQPQKTVSHHLSKLKDMGLVYDERRGKEVWYTADPRRVRVEHDAADGALLLTVTAAGDAGVSVTLRLPRPAAEWTNQG